MKSSRWTIQSGADDNNIQSDVSGKFSVFDLSSLADDEREKATKYSDAGRSWTPLAAWRIASLVTDDRTPVKAPNQRVFLFIHCPMPTIDEQTVQAQWIEPHPRGFDNPRPNTLRHQTMVNSASRWWFWRDLSSKANWNCVLLFVCFFLGRAIGAWGLDRRQRMEDYSKEKSRFQFSEGQYI